MRALLLLLPLGALAGPEEPPAGPADLLLVGGRVLTLDSVRPETAALAIRGGRILFLGSEAEVRALVGPDTRVLDVAGGWILPSFQDAHGHLAGLAAALLQVDLTGTRSYAEVVERTRRAAADQPEGSWILGRGWDQNDWAEPVFPDHGPLSAAIPDHLVLLTRVDGHAVLANARALELAGVGPETPDPPGGRILRRPDGTPTGVLVDAAVALVRRHLPPRDGSASGRACGWPSPGSTATASPPSTTPGSAPTPSASTRRWTGPGSSSSGSTSCSRTTRRPWPRGCPGDRWRTWRGMGASPSGR